MRNWNFLYNIRKCLSVHECLQVENSLHSSQMKLIDITEISWKYLYLTKVHLIY